MDKKQIRLQYKKIRENIIDKKEKSSIISDFATDIIASPFIRTVSIYSSFADEVDTSEIIDICLKIGKIVVVPKIIGDFEMIMVKIESIDDLSEINKYGIKEPKSMIPYLGSIEMTIVPGLVFDTNGARIGYGKGFYDKFLKTTDTIRVGICFNEQLIDDKLPESENDERMNMIITDKRRIFV